MHAYHILAPCFACHNTLPFTDLTASSLSLGFTLPLPQRSLNRVPELGTEPSGFHPASDVEEWGKDPHLGIFLIGSSEATLGGLQVAEF